MQHAVISSRLGFEREVSHPIDLWICGSWLALGHMGPVVDHKVTQGHTGDRSRYSNIPHSRPQLGYTHTYIHHHLVTQDPSFTITLHHHVTIQAHAKIVHIV